MIIRKIIHIDMDAFYASVEQRDFPELRGKAVAVGGSAERGVVAAASYEARKFGVRSAMASVIAARRCPELIFVKPRFPVYKEVSEQIREIFKRYTDLVEPLSLDEAYLDVTENKIGLPSATLIAKEIRKRILEETRLTASAGISINKFLAKVASDFNKPDGQKLIPPEEALDFMESLQVAKFPYVGKKTAEKMYAQGIYFGKDLKKKSLEQLLKYFGKNGRYFYEVVRCEQNSPVVANRERKSLGAEITFEKDVSGEEALLNKLWQVEEILWNRLLASKIYGRTVTLKIKDHNFDQTTRSQTQLVTINNRQELKEILKHLLFQPTLPTKPVRLLGIYISNLNDKKKTVVTQLTLKF